jgi:cysteine desulfurase
MWTLLKNLPLPTYFDHAASTPMDEEALITLTESYRNDYPNPSAKFRWATELKNEWEKSKTFLSQYLSPKLLKHRVTITSSVTEANNLFIYSLLRQIEANENESLTLFYDESDHPSLVQALTVWRSRFPDVKMKMVSFPRRDFYELGQSDFEEVVLSFLQKNQESTKGALLLSWVHGQSGHQCPLQFSSSFFTQLHHLFPLGFHLFLDITQGLGKIPFDLEFPTHHEHIQVSLSLSGHKSGGPKGIGALMTPLTFPLSPLLIGGDHEEGARASTLNYPLLKSWVKALNNLDPYRNYQHGLELAEYFSSKLQLILQEKSLEKHCWFVFPQKMKGPFSTHSPFIHLIAVWPYPSDVIVRHLEMHRIYLATSTACSGPISKSHLPFIHMGIEEKYHQHLLRISFSPHTQKTDIDILVQTLIMTLQELVAIF